MNRLFITGDSPLVEEYDALCTSRGLDVAARINPKSVHRGSPKGVRRMSKPTRAMGIALELTNLSAEMKKKNLMELERTLSRSAVIVSSSVTITLTEQSTWMKHPERLVGLGAFPTFLGGNLVELTKTPLTATSASSTAGRLFSQLGKETALVRDSPGLVMPRIWCMLINEAYFAMMEGVAAGKDIDTAMKLGTNYPSGPVEMAQSIGIRHIYATLTALNRYYSEDRYRLAPLLQESAIREELLNQ